MSAPFPAPNGRPVIAGPDAAGPGFTEPAATGGRPRPEPDVPLGIGPDNPPPPASSVATLRFMGRGTLSRQLVLRLTLLVAVIAIALSGLTIVAVQRVFEGNLDRQLQEMAGRANNAGTPGGSGHGNFRDPSGGGIDRQDGLLFYGISYPQPNSPIGIEQAFVQVGRTSQSLSEKAKAQLDALPTDASGKALATVNLDDVGSYRVIVFTASGNRNVLGLPQSLVNGPLVVLLPWALALTLASIALAFVLARTVVQRSLRPLQRLATTAHDVGQLELDAGEVDVPVRVPESDTDPRSEIGQVGLAFNHMLDNVENALAARQRSETKVRQFVADASHELRNPLASIRGYAELTRRERDDAPPTTAHALTRIESESNRMSALVEDLLLLARLDTGPNYLTLRPVAMNELVANAVSDAQAAGPDHDWELSLPEGDVIAAGDAFRLHQVVANLLANARTHTPAGTHVRTSLAAEGGHAVVRVSDDGGGIPPAIRDKVFERFTRADASRVRSGKGQSTGLGLAIVAAVVAAHHGAATLDSTSGGTTFTIRIPLAS